MSYIRLFFEDWMGFDFTGNNFCLYKLIVELIPSVMVNMLAILLL